MKIDCSKTENFLKEKARITNNCYNCGNCPLFEFNQLKDILMKYFEIGDSYTYNLTRTKEGFNARIMSLEDFEEFNEGDIEDLTQYIIENISERL